MAVTEEGDALVIGTDMANADTSNYNAFGLYVFNQKRDLSLNEVARRGGISEVTLGRRLRQKPFKIPDPEFLQAVAQGLGRPVGSVYMAALDAAGHPGLAFPKLTVAQQTMVDAASTHDVQVQQMLADVVLRVSEEINRRDEAARG